MMTDEQKAACVDWCNFQDEIVAFRARAQRLMMQSAWWQRELTSVEARARYRIESRSRRAQKYTSALL